MPLNNMTSSGRTHFFSGRVVVAFGSVALVAQMLTVSISTLARHLGIALPGSIEIVQIIIAIIASTALLTATAFGVHAAVHLIVDRIGHDIAAVINRIICLLSCMFWLLLVIGSGWIILDVWGEHEQTILLGIPLVPIRVIWVVACLMIAGQLIKGDLLKQRPENSNES
jgi:TRAP-type C4-dicarboxylate transport system permease small subunit